MLLQRQPAPAYGEMGIAAPAAIPARRPRIAAAHLVVARDLGLVAAASVLVRLPWVLLMRHGLVWDSTFYYQSAKSIAAGHGYSILGHPTAFFPVGWPAFLAFFFELTGPSLWTVMALNLALWGAVAALVYALGRRMGGRRAGFVAALIVATSPTLALYVLRPYSEALFIPLLLGAVLLLTARRETPTLRVAALAGICLGLAILVRSTAAPLPVVLGLWLLVRNPWRASWRPAAVFAAVACLVVAPWIIRNEVVMHAPNLSTNGGYTLWVSDIADRPGAPHKVYRWPLGSARSEVRQNAKLTTASLDFALEHPGGALASIPGKFRTLMSWNSSPLMNALRFQTGPNPQGAYTMASPASLKGAEGVLVRGALANSWLFQLWHYAFWLLGGLAMLVALRRRVPGAGLVLLLVAFWIVVHSVLFFGDVRFMTSVTPLVAAPLGWMLAGAPHRRRAALPGTRRRDVAARPVADRERQAA